jgi:hypothetical protein
MILLKDRFCLLQVLYNLRFSHQIHFDNNFLRNNIVYIYILSPCKVLHVSTNGTLVIAIKTEEYRKFSQVLHGVMPLVSLAPRYLARLQYFCYWFNKLKSMLSSNDVTFTPSVVNVGQLVDIQKGAEFFWNHKMEAALSLKMLVSIYLTTRRPF